MLSQEPQFRLDHLNEITSIIQNVFLDEYGRLFSFINSGFVSSQSYVLEINQSESDIAAHVHKLEELVPQTTKEQSHFYDAAEYIEMKEFKHHKLKDQVHKPEDHPVDYTETTSHTHTHDNEGSTS